MIKCKLSPIINSNLRLRSGKFFPKRRSQVTPNIKVNIQLGVEILSVDIQNKTKIRDEMYIPYDPFKFTGWILMSGSVLVSTLIWLKRVKDKLKDGRSTLKTVLPRVTS